MATESARPSRHRNLWQLPTLLLGIGSLVAVWYARPYLRPTPAQRYERDLVQLRQTLEKAVPDVAAVQPLLRRVESVPAPERLAAQAHFLRGSGYVVLAEAATDPKEAGEYWKMAREHLDAATPAGGPPGGQPRVGPPPRHGPAATPA